MLYRGQKDALAEFLPLNAQNWIVCGSALRLDWLFELYTKMTAKTTIGPAKPGKSRKLVFQ